jgi:AhpD family alkylhydroperoxidase
MWLSDSFPSQWKKAPEPLAKSFEQCRGGVGMMNRNGSWLPAMLAAVAAVALAFAIELPGSGARADQSSVSSGQGLGIQAGNQLGTEDERAHPDPKVLAAGETRQAAVQRAVAGETYPAMMAAMLEYMKEFEAGQPDVMTSFYSLHQATLRPGALDPKVKELISLGIAVSARCDGCIAFHVHGSLEAGATEKEIMEVLGVAVMMGGGPSLAYATHAIEAFEQFETTQR